MKNEKLFKIFFLSFLFLIISSRLVFAESDYVLPYPSFMPGSVFYKVNLLKEQVMKYWYFGDFGQFDYNLKQSDRYTVEAKTLFEYKQYLLAYNALKKSDEYFKNLRPNLENARKENKNIEQKQKLLKNASLKHLETFNFIKTIVPKEFIWKPEKAGSTQLNLEQTIEESIRIRNF